MHPFSNAYSTAQYGGGEYVTRELMLLHQRRALEAEINAIEDRQRRADQRRRRQSIINQALRVESLLKQVQRDRDRHTLPSHANPPAATPIDGRTSSVDWMLTKLMQQNDELHAIIRNQQSNIGLRLSEALPSLFTKFVNSPGDSDPQTCRSKDPNAVQDDCNEPPVEPVAAQNRVSNNDDLALTAKAWSAVEDLPELDWTESDEQMLETLLQDESAKHEGLLAGEKRSIADVNVDAILMRKQHQHDRQASRRKIVQMYEASSLANNAGIRRPRWRIEQDIVDGVVRPYDENGDGAVCELPMPARQLFRSGVVAVMAVIELMRLLYEKKLRVRDKSVQDLEPMLNVYFDATRVWLAKLVKTPLLSVVQDSALDIDVSVRSGIFRGSNGLSKWLVRLRSAPTHDPVNNASAVEYGRIVKIKVRVKGIVDAIVKAIDKGDVPSGILQFWKRITSEGVFFPSSYQLFSLEQEALDLDDLGGTRNVQANHKGDPRFQIVLVNFMMLRTLVPHVVVRPWEIGIGNANPSKSVAANLKNVASLLYAILARLSPLPSIISEPESGIRLGMRRRSVGVVPTGTEVASHGNNEDDAASSAAKRFLSINEIHSLLIPDKQFPVSEFETFVNEQQLRLRDVFRILQAKLHPQSTEQQVIAT